jgi:hypothetical protein
MAWKDIGEARFRCYSEYRDMLQNLSDTQALCTEQFLRIQELNRELKKKDEMLQKLLHIALLTNPEQAQQAVELVRGELPIGGAAPSIPPVGLTTYQPPPYETLEKPVSHVRKTGSGS